MQYLVLPATFVVAVVDRYNRWFDPGQNLDHRNLFIIITTCTYARKSQFEGGNVVTGLSALD